ncbi:hypothetical protein [Tsukamurella sp. 1534]|uniref:hypothetical protein n=1 Tax=Tsukamurella sp. 1534 TaxID=1151061 RepID=UPI0002F50433|nr:hypothetical protein [Tsukamurella sp. 1534]
MDRRAPGANDDDHDNDHDTASGAPLRPAGAHPADGHPRAARPPRKPAAALDAALAEYRDRTYATWSAPDDPGADVSLLADRRIEAALRAAPSPQVHGRRMRYGLAGAAAAVATVAAVAVALTVVTQPETVEPGNEVLLAAATPGGDRGPFAEMAALTRCLDAARVPPAQRTLLGAGPVEIRGDAATALLLPGRTLGDLLVLAVTPSCADGAASSVLLTRTLAAARPTAPATGGVRTP